MFTESLTLIKLMSAIYFSLTRPQNGNFYQYKCKPQFLQHLIVLWQNYTRSIMKTKFVGLFGWFMTAGLQKLKLKCAFLRRYKSYLHVNSRPNNIREKLAESWKRQLNRYNRVNVLFSTGLAYKRISLLL